mmetsp:Transcript_21377/g.34223  ORF Transcript_21377/g.34223 Transcript_21377/m.34223 type:complete len:619 (-) Transcript_21377:577-2433(-)
MPRVVSTLCGEKAQENVQVELKISPPSTPEYDECAESRAATPRLVARRGRPAGVRSKIDVLYTGLRCKSSVKHSSSEDTTKAMSHTSQYKPQIICGTRSGRAKQTGESSMLTSIPIRSPDALESADRPRRDVVKRKRLIEDDAINEISQSALSQALCRLKAVANSLALTFGHLFQGWVGSKSEFEVGDTVMARYYDGQWFAAVVDELLEESGGSPRFRVIWDDGDPKSRVKTAKEMLLLEDFTKRAEKTVKRQKVRHSLNSQTRSGSGKGETFDLVNEKEKAGAGSAGNAVYTFEGATGDGNDSAFSRRDWGLRTVAAVGRNRPPFARTMLCHGTLPFPLPPDLKTGVGGRGTYTRNWVVKKWPSKTSAERMRTDKQVHQVIQKHPHANIVRILDVSATEGVLMELFEEGDLHKHMATARRKYMATKDIVRYMLELLSSLDHLHSLDIVHCDVTPSNIFLRRRRDKEDVLRQEAVAAHHAAAEKGRGGGGGARERELAPVYYTCALGDFGHSYIVDQHEQSRSSVAQLGLGVEFVAPEVKEGGGSTKESDVWSAGKILDQLLKIAAAFSGEVKSEPKSVVRKLRGLSLDMCCNLTCKRPSARAACLRLESLTDALNCI